MKREICSVYRSPNKAGLYLYVSKSQGLQAVPEPLLASFGEPELVMTLLLSPAKKLAHADVARVLECLEEQGYYLQMPPAPEAYMQAINQHNSKLY